MPTIQQAIQIYENHINYDYYFSYDNETKYIAQYKNLQDSIYNRFESIGLKQDEVAQIHHFLDIINNLSQKRKTYNDKFVESEAVKYAEFFKTLDKYPLSHDQIEAVIRDEDNNLVLAGAGTGKTTTISAKVAYILKKGLAKPDELLIISFTKNAVNEMFSRTTSFCQGLLGDKVLDVRTFNSFGFMVKRQVRRGEIKLAFDGSEDQAKAFLQKTFNDLFINDADFHSKAVNFIAFFSRPEQDDFAFQTQDEYIRHERNFNNISLNGIRVKSKEEMAIANFFYLHHVNFEYEKRFPLLPEDETYERGTYYPDFYLTDYDVWHEHYGIDREGNVPAWFSYRPPYPNARTYYHSLMIWKQGIHEKYQTKLITTYSYENTEHKLLSNLKQKLLQHGVVLTKRKPEEILQVIQGSEHYESFMDLVYTFLTLMKSNGKTPADLNVPNDKRFSIFMDVFKQLYEKYQSQLSANKQIDFNDMINEAAYHIRQGDYLKPYKYILVDEFQDMSLGRYQLLNSLKTANPGAKLYAVGDDWQSIFRFTGSDISIITDFKNHFGYTKKSKIIQTYRFNDAILNVSSHFIQQNPSQLKKQLKSTFKANGEAFYLKPIDLRGMPTEEQKTIKPNQIEEILFEIEQLGSGNEVFFIGRYHHNQPASFKQHQRNHPQLNLSYHTAHKVKGLTCDYAIVLDVDAGTYGFPSEVADDPILNYLLKEGESFENAEERRLFYVALTRARHRNYLLFSAGNPSKFIEELAKQDGITNPFIEAVICPSCKGRMVIRTSSRGNFYGCNNYPQCTATQPVPNIKKPISYTANLR